MYNIIRTLPIALFGLLFTVTLAAQEGGWVVGESSTFSVEGTSTLRSWTVEAPSVQGTLLPGDAFRQNDLPAAGSVIEGFTFEIPVSTMDGGIDAMNSKMQKALKMETHPHISYSLAKATVKTVDEANGLITLESQGTVTIAGVSQEVNIEVSGKKEAGQWQFTGQQSLKMSDFNIDPPSAMFGQIVAGDEVKISFDLKVKP